MLKRLVTFLVAMLAALTLVASPAVASTGGDSPPPPDAGGTRAWLVYIPSTTTMTATGNTSGWSRGHITIYGELRAPNGAIQWERENECWDTYCSIPSYTFCPAVHGRWTMRVIAYGPGGRGEDIAEAYV